MEEFIKLLLNGLFVSVIGIGITFILMALLILLIYLTKYIFANNQKAPANTIVKEVQQEETIIADGKLDPKVVAAITAAINCYYAESGVAPRAGFIVRSIKKRI